MNKLIVGSFFLFCSQTFAIEVSRFDDDANRYKIIANADELKAVAVEIKEAAIKKVLAAEDECIISLFKFSELRSSLPFEKLMSIQISEYHAHYVEMSLRFGYEYQARRITFKFENSSLSYLCSGSPKVFEKALATMR